MIVRGGTSLVRPRVAVRNRGSWQSQGLQQWYAFTRMQGGAELEIISNTFSAPATVNGPVPYVFGKDVGLARDFDSGRVDGLAAPDVAVTQALSVVVWTTVETSTNNGHLYSRHPGWFLSKTGATNVRFAVNTGSEVSVNFGTITALADGNMHCLVAVYNGATITTYVDGVQANQSAQTGNIDLSGATGVGYYRGSPASGSFAWDGQIADVRQYNRVLSAGEVAALFAPASRWALYRVPNRRALDAPAAATLSPLSWAPIHRTTQTAPRARVVASGMTPPSRS